MSAPRGPHQRIRSTNDRESWLAGLLDRLWDVYRGRVEHVRTYERIVQQYGATFVNDHIAFRTFACQRPQTGIVSLSRIFQVLGYRAAGVYQFEDKFLNAVHFQHANPQFPKIFISELRVWELGSQAEPIWQLTRQHRPAIADEVLAELAAWRGMSESRQQELQDLVVREFHELPWPVPEREVVEAVNRASQYAAWVMLHGYNVNHFTSLVNSHDVPELEDLDKTLAALREAGVPVKAEIEGEPGSKLRQSATEAVRIEVDMLEHGQPRRLPWSYAYFELAERNPIVDPVTGQVSRFEGFLGPQATHLFEMTRTAKG